MKDLINTFDRSFIDLHRRSFEFIGKLPQNDLFFRPDNNLAMLSCGEYIIRGAGKVEQTFGGITSRLWDDPFEWSLPEELSTVKKIRDYLNEVEVTRTRGFGYFSSDHDLRKELPAPEEMKTVFSLLVETLVTAGKFQEMAIIARNTLVKVRT